MNEKELIERIRFEEKVRFDIQKELSEKNEKKDNSIWKFLNSNFGLFVLSSIVLGLISWAYSEQQLKNKISLEKAQVAGKLLTEMQYRANLMERKFEEIKLTVDTSKWLLAYDIEDIFKGQTERVMRGKNTVTEFTPVFAEYTNRKIPSLYWEFLFATSKSNKIEEKNMTNNLIEFDIFLNDLITKDLDSDAGFSSKDINKLGKIFDDFKSRLKSKSD